MWHYEAKGFKSKTFERMQRQKVNANAKPFEPETFGLENLEVGADLEPFRCRKMTERKLSPK